MRTPSPSSARGFSILETMIAMVVLAIGLIGALAALQRGATEARLGQNRQVKMMLAEAALQRVKLQPKDSYFAGCTSTGVCSTLPAQPSVYIGDIPVGQSGSVWVKDPTPYSAVDFSTGAFFDILPDGTITPRDYAGSCTAITVPVGTICREVYTHLGAPFAVGGFATVVGGALTPGTRIATTWVRVTRKSNRTDQMAGASGVTDRLDNEDQITLNQVVIQ